MEPISVLLAIYLIMAIFFLVPTYLEGLMRGDRSLKLSVLSILCCAVWPFLVVYVLILQRKPSRA